jgi:AraC-like DNA-binding protein
VREPQRLCLDASWLLRPILRHSEADQRLASAVDEYLRGFSSDVDAIRCGAKLRIPRQAAFDLFETLAEEAAAPDLALAAIAPRPSETLLDYVCTTAPTLEGALAALCATNRLQNDVPVDLELGTRAILRHAYGSDHARQIEEGIAATLVKQLRDAVGDDWSPREVRFEHARPKEIEALAQHFRCPIVFGAPTFELHIAREDLARPLRRGDAALHALLRGFATDELSRMAHPRESATQAVRIALRNALPLFNASLPAIAAQLGVGARTLQRRLDDEGTEFGLLVDTTRRELVIALLADPRRTLREVAWQAGFADVSALHRAVRRWTGQRPSELRKRPRT